MAMAHNPGSILCPSRRAAAIRRPDPAAVVAPPAAPYSSPSTAIMSISTRIPANCDPTVVRAGRGSGITSR